MPAIDPRVPVTARVNRAFMHRATRWLTRQGVRRFPDIGTGIPTEPNPHQIAQQVAPEARVVHCDNDPIVLAHAAALLRSTPQGATEYLRADVREPDAILAGARRVLDLDRPVAPSLVALLRFIADEDGAHDLVGRLVAELPSASYPMMTHATADFAPEESAAATEKLKAAGVTLAPRSREEFTRFFDSLALVDPGVGSSTSGTPDWANRSRGRTTG